MSADPVTTPAAASEAAWSVQTLGTNLLDRYNVAFEGLSVVLLLAIIGAITIAGRTVTTDNGGDA